MSRFLTADEIEAKEKLRESKKKEWEAEEKRLKQAREADFKVREASESLYLPHQDKLEPQLVTLWNEFAEARDLHEPVVVRTESGFELKAYARSDRSASRLPLSTLMTVYITPWEGLRIYASQTFFEHNPPRDFASAVATETGREVELTDVSGRTIQTIEP